MQIRDPQELPRPKLTIIVGVGGSGKTHFGRKLAETEDVQYFFDDFTVPHPDRRRAGFKGLGETIFRLQQGVDCIVDESHLTVTGFREDFREFLNQFLPDVEQRWIFFERNVLASINNAYDAYHNQNRRDLGRLKAIYGQLIAYTVPPFHGYPGYQIEKCYKGGVQHFIDEPIAHDWLERAKDGK